MFIVEKKERETSREYAIRTIRENIVRLELAPGSLVSEKELADQLGLSRTPVREALIDLSKVKIVEIFPQKGIQVALIDYALVEEARFIRLVLEKGIVETLCQQGLSPSQEAALVENLRLQEFYVQNPMSNRLFSLDDQFHQLLFQFANRELAYNLTKSVNVHFDRVRSMTVNVESKRDESLVHEHWEILEAILQRDCISATDYLTQHLDRYQVDACYIREHFAKFLKP